MRLHIRKIASGEDSYAAVIICVNGPIILERVLYTTIERLTGKVGIHVISSP
jgi:hypothetical protein